MNRSETPAKLGLNRLLQLGVFVAELDRIVQLIDADIRIEEERSRVFDRSSATYPIIARQLRLRRQNLIATISLLEGKRVGASA